MTIAISMIAISVFLAAAVTGVFVMLAVGIRASDRAGHLASTRPAHLDTITRRVLGVGVRADTLEGRGDSRTSGTGALHQTSLSPRGCHSSVLAG